MGKLVWVLLLFAVTCPRADARTGTASWYSVESCKREGTSGIMANGHALKDDALTAASWDYPFGSWLAVSTVTAQGLQRTVRVQVSDRGPSKRLYKSGRIIDLSKAAFLALAPLPQGVIPVTVTVLR